MLFRKVLVQMSDWLTTMGLSRRLRRLRGSENLRNLVRETRVSVSQLIYPIFVTAGKNIKHEISSMPGQYRLSLDRLVAEAEEVARLGIPGIILFGLPESKDPEGTGAYADDGIVQRAVRLIKAAVPELCVMTDVCLCEYTDHGHCGLIVDGQIVNDATLRLLTQTARSHAEAGADLVAPSAMMDGQVVAIRDGLDECGFEGTPIMSYAAKYASAFYGPFREAADSSPQFGDRRSYQMDPPNAREALLEMELDFEEGADILMVKPAMSFLDIIRLARENFDLPIAAYNVSGEYSMIKAAGRNGWIDEAKVRDEVLIGMARAGADIIITYFAKEYAKSQ